jgi:hypothetical protein
VVRRKTRGRQQVRSQKVRSSIPPFLRSSLGVDAPTSIQKCQAHHRRALPEMGFPKRLRRRSDRVEAFDADVLGSSHSSSIVTPSSARRSRNRRTSSGLGRLIPKWRKVAARSAPEPAAARVRNHRRCRASALRRRTSALVARRIRSATRRSGRPLLIRDRKGHARGSGPKP